MHTFTTSIGTTYPNSTVTLNDTSYFLIRLHDSDEKRLTVIGNADGFASEQQLEDGTILCELTPHNASELRRRLSWLNPTPLGTTTSFGFGDRLGVATPGHIEAIRATGGEGQTAPIFAQQSVRENTRTGRNPGQVMNDAVWGLLQEGWRSPWGADADHVKEVDVLPPFIEAGYTFYTIDPSDYVDSAANSEQLDALREKVAALAWDRLDSNLEAMVSHYTSKPIKLDGLTLTFDDLTLFRALAKYGNALAHTITISRALADLMGGKPFDLEMSVDETDTPTSIYEHYFIVNELIRCGVPVVSLAPRFVGKFQKGVDYIGDTSAFEREFEKHAAIMRHFGSYKISIHSGSDKFSLYPIIARHTGGKVHVKTAGTSYLEALRVMANVDPALFKQALDLAHARFEKERKTYFLDCQPDRVPTADAISDGDLPSLLDEFHARQLLHVTYGSILDEYGDALNALLAVHEDAYKEALSLHFQRHLKPFVPA